jgi:hypothetical protein
MHPYVSSTGINRSAVAVVCSPVKKGKCVMNLKLVAAAAASLLVATPALAAQRVDHHRQSRRVQHARKFDYRSVYGAYGFDRGDDFASGNDYDDFARRNTFN